MPSLVLLWPALPGAALVALVRAAFHYGGGHLARRLAARLHGSQWREKLRPNAAEDFAERIFYAVGHTLCTVLGGWVCLRNGWLTGPGELFFTPQERQRLICSILAARPAVGGAGIDTAMLLAGRVWRVPLPPGEEAAELEREARAFGWARPLPLRDLPQHQIDWVGGHVAVFDSLFCAHSSRARFLWWKGLNLVLVGASSLEALGAFAFASARRTQEWV